MSSKTKNLKLLKKVLVEPSKFREQKYQGKACFSQAYTKYGFLEDWSTALSILNDLPENENVFNELILDNTKVKPYLDVEWFKSEFPKYKANDIKYFISKLLKEIFIEEYEIYLDSCDILFSSCHRSKDTDYKYSYHIIISTHPTVVYNDTNSASFLARKLREKCIQTNLFHESLVDLNPYKKTQNMRLVGHSKDNEFIPLKKDDIEVNDIEYIITNIDKDFTVLTSEEQEDSLFKSIKNIDINSIDKNLDTVINTVKKIHPTAEYQHTDTSGFIQFNYLDRSENCFSGSNIYHNKIGFFVYIFNNLICAGCHSGRCVDNNNKKIIKVIGNIDENIDNNFESVNFNNEFTNINHDFIKDCIINGALGISNLFERMYLKPKRIKWITEGGRKGSSYFWDGKIWQEDDHSFIERLLVTTVVRLLRHFVKIYNENNEISDFMEELIEETQAIIVKLNNGLLINNILRFSTPLIVDKGFSKIKDIHPYLLSCKNGMVNLINGEIRDSVPEDNITKCIDTEYNINADTTDFDKFVRQITSNEKGEDEEKYNFLKWCIGYSLQGQPKRKIFIILYGIYGFNGKSLLINTIGDVLEYYSITMDKSVVLENGKKTSGSHSTEICQLENCRQGVLSDTKENAEINDGQMKQLTGITDKLSVREIYGKQKEFTPTFVPIINTNHAININLSDKSMYERFVLITFSLSFVDEPSKSFERLGDNTLAEKFKNNREGVLKWLIDASIYYNKNQDNPIPDFVKKDKEQYNKQINSYLDFIDKNIIRTCNEEDNVKRVELLALYKEYCKENSIKYMAKTVEKELDKILEFKYIKNRKVYIKIKISVDEDEEDDLL